MDPGTNDPAGYIHWGDGAIYSVRIIGINHDDKADGTGKAGLTFQFVNCLKTTYRHRTSYTNSGGWGSSLIKASMYNGDIYKAAPELLRNNMATVTKAYLNGSVGDGSITRKVGQDRFFLPSHAEVVTNLIRNTPSTADKFDFRGLKQEGSLYAYWAALEIGTTQESFSHLMKTAGDDGAAISTWGTRSCYRGNYTYYMATGTAGAWLGAREPVYIYISPCFAI